MPKARQKPTEQPPSPKPLPSLEEFREAVKYALTHDHGMPPLYADEVMESDHAFVERHWQNYDKGENTVALTADGLLMESPKGVKWIPLAVGQRVADKNQVVLNADGAIGNYLDSLVQLGLHGQDRDAVASIMLAKGIESVFPLIAANMGSKAN